MLGGRVKADSALPAGPVVSDNGMFIIDAPFPPEKLEDPAKVRIP